MEEALNAIRKQQHQSAVQRMQNNRESLFSGLYEKYNISYHEDTDERHRADFFSLRPHELRPVILEIHGGGLVSCNKDINVLHARFLAHQGFHVINTEYRLQPETDFFGQLSDIYAVLNWMVQNASALFLDTSHLYISGDSSGAHLALLTALSQYSKEMRCYFHLPDPQWEIQAMILSCPLHDLRFYMEHTRYGAFVGSPETPETYLSHSSVGAMLPSSKLPPAFIVTTKGDKNYYAETHRLHHILQENDTFHVYKEYASCGNPLRHVFNVLYPEWEESRAANMDSIDFLRSFS